MRRLLVQLSGLYVALVAMFAGAGAVHQHPGLEHTIRTSAIEVRDSVSNWTRDTANTVHDSMVAWLDERTATKPPLRGPQREEQSQPQTAQAVPPPPSAPNPMPAKPRALPPQPQIAIAEPPKVAPTEPESPPVRTVRITPEHQIPDAPLPPMTEPEDQHGSQPQMQDDTQVAQAPSHDQAPAPRAVNHPPSNDQIARVRERLRASLSTELYANFDLFLYVSKADRGQWAQRLFVFAKNGDDLRMMNSWPVSTGREANEIDTNGNRQSTDTPAGYYQLDPGRMIRNYHSVQWNAPMPFAMFFNWIDRGNATGLAIHGVEGQELALLGSRASAGCVRIAPDAAQNLFNLIKGNYRGQVPRFAMDRRRATMSNRGELMHDSHGQLVQADGYRVLVYIDNYGGDEMVSAIY